MPSSPKTGQVRPLPESESQYPGKRPKVEKDMKSKKFAKKNAKKLKKQRQSLPENCSPEDVQWKDIVNLLGVNVVDSAIEEGTEFQSPFAYHEVLELEVKAICSNGDGLAQSD
ncbi:hypothetical protein MPER_10025, partial [Moniliophthora perniciosa FA553]